MTGRRLVQVGVTGTSGTAWRARARGLRRFRARNSTMPENKEPPVRSVEAFFLAFIHF